MAGRVQCAIGRTGMRALSKPRLEQTNALLGRRRWGQLRSAPWAGGGSNQGPSSGGHVHRVNVRGESNLGL